MSLAGAAPLCGPDEHCITCGDHAVPMRVVRLDRSSRLAWCSAVDDDAGSEVDVGLVGDVVPGELVLVHAGTALLRLPDPEGAAA